MSGYDALVLSGGRATRLGGADKPSLPIGGTALLDRVLDAVRGADRRIVVGPPCEGADVVTREQPPGGGPVAAVAAGLAHVVSPVVAVLAADLPFLTAATVEGLLAALEPGADAVVLIDGDGRDQLLISLWRTRALRARLHALGDPEGQPVRALLRGLAVQRWSAPVTAGEPPPWLDCDTYEDLRRAREWA